VGRAGKWEAVPKEVKNLRAISISLIALFTGSRKLFATSDTSGCGERNK